MASVTAFNEMMGQVHRWNLQQNFPRRERIKKMHDQHLILMKETNPRLVVDGFHGKCNRHTRIKLSSKG